MQLSKWTGLTKSQILLSIDQTIDMLLNYKYFVLHKSILAFCNYSDAFLNCNTDYTLNLLFRLDRLKVQNPLVIITKSHIPIDIINELLKIENIRLILCLTYSQLPDNIEKGVDHKKLLLNFKNLSEKSFRIVHFWRPIIDINGSIEVINNVLANVTRYCNVSAYNGLNLSPDLNRIYTNSTLLNLGNKLFSSHGEYIPEKSIKVLLDTITKYYPNHSIYKHTSCSISNVLSIPDYNATIYRKDICEHSNCPAKQREICQKSKVIPSEDKVEQLFDDIGYSGSFSINNDRLEICGRINQEDYTYLLHHLNFPIYVYRLDYSRSLRGSIFKDISKRSKQR